jgi:hypothetical protein
MGTVHTRFNRILSLDGDRILVATTISPEGSVVRIKQVQDALDRLNAEGELEISVGSLSHRRSSFVGALLAAMPGVVADPETNSVRLSGRKATEDHLPAEIAEAVDAVAELAGRRPRRRRGQGWLQSSEARQAISGHAVARAIRYFVADGWQVEDVGDITFYDLDCTKDGRSLHVEVKGTTSAGEKVLLTRNEVTHAQAQDQEVALFVLSDVRLHRMEDGSIRARGGTERILWPWDIGMGQLEALAFEYVLPRLSKTQARGPRGSARQ